MRRRWMAAGVSACAGALALSQFATGCGASEGSLFGSGGEGASSSGDNASGGQVMFGDASLGTPDGTCTGIGSACGDGGKGMCTSGGMCCPAENACGDVCCGGAQVCSFRQCVVPGSTCHDVSDCGEGSYCEFSLGSPSASPADGGVGGGTDGGAMCVGGAQERTGKCLPKPPVCPTSDGGASPGAGVTCLEKCEVRPSTNFTPALKYSWGGPTTPNFASDIMMAPIVIELDDDDCDGKVTERDIPEIVFTTFASGAYNAAGTLRAISIVNGAVVEKWSVPGVIHGTKQIAAGNFDGLPGNEIVACGKDGKVYAYSGAGQFLWSTIAPRTCFMPSIADLDGDGAVEVIVEGGILDGATGALKALFVPALNGPFVVSDIDGDGQLDIVTSSRGYHADGLKFVDTGLAEAGSFPDTGDWKGPWSGIADFDLDGKPEIVAVDNLNHTVLVWRYDAAAPQKFTIVRGPTDMNTIFTNGCPVGSWGATHGGGAPTIADFDRDGVPDVGLAGGIGYVVFDGKKLIDPNITGPNTILWGQPTFDCSSASTGSTVFDFDGDGKAEVVYSDQLRMRIYEGATGVELASICNTTATLSEFPVVADVDNDGHADIVVVSNAYSSMTCNDGTSTKQSGVRVFGSATGSFVRTRRIWNEHAYHVTNVAEDGTIPRNEPNNWTQLGLNNFRQNKQPGSEFAAPNVVVALSPLCAGSTVIQVAVRNFGEALLPAGVLVGVYSGSPPSATKLGAVRTTRALFPAESELLDFSSPALATAASAYVLADDGAPPHPSWVECRTDDNSATVVQKTCDITR